MKRENFKIRLLAGVVTLAAVLFLSGLALPVTPDALLNHEDGDKSLTGSMVSYAEAKKKTKKDYVQIDTPEAKRDRRILKKMIKQARGGGGRRWTGISKKLTSYEYKWDKNGRLTAIDWSYCDIQASTLKVGKLTKLERLDIGETYTKKLKKLDVSQAVSLKELYCPDNFALKEIKVGKKSSIEELILWNIDLTKLDLSRFPKLTYLDCEGTAIKELKLSAVPKLKNLYCEYTGISQLNLADVPRLENLACSGSKIRSFDFSNSAKLKLLDASSCKLDSINLSGLRDIKELYLSFNNLTQIDLSGLTNLKQLWVDANYLENLDVSGLPALTTLCCSDNKLTELNVSQNANLKGLECNDNRLTSLILTQNKNLKALYCSDNEITTLDVSQNPKLWIINCHSNKLAELDVTAIKKLQVLICTKNNLTTLDLSRNGEMYHLECDRTVDVPGWKYSGYRNDSNQVVHYWIQKKKQ